MEKVYCMAEACAHTHIWEYGLRYHYAYPVGSGDRPSPFIGTRRFKLERTSDPTGISGTGTVADGILWADQSVCLKWRGEKSSTVFWACVEDMLAIHGHGGATTVKWID
jgi:hypothetical protein